MGFALSSACDPSLCSLTTQRCMPEQRHRRFGPIAWELTVTLHCLILLTWLVTQSIMSPWLVTQACRPRHRLLCFLLGASHALKEGTPLVPPGQPCIARVVARLLVKSKVTPSPAWEPILQTGTSHCVFSALPRLPRVRMRLACLSVPDIACLYCNLVESLQRNPAAELGSEGRIPPR